MARSAYSADEDEHQKRYKADKKDKKDKKDNKHKKDKKHKYEHHSYTSSSTECSTATSGTPGPSGPIGFGPAGPPPQPNRPWIYTGGTQPNRPPQQPSQPPRPPQPNQNPPYPSLHDPQPPRPPAQPRPPYWQQNSSVPVNSQPYGPGYHVPQPINTHPGPSANGFPNTTGPASQPPHVGLNAAYYGQSMPPPGTTPGPTQNQIPHQPPYGVPPSVHTTYAQPYPLSPNIQQPNFVSSSGWLQNHNPTQGQIQPPQYPPMGSGNGYGQQGVYGNQYNWRPYGQ